MDAKGNLYVGDVGHRIQVYAPGVTGWEQVNINGFGNPSTDMITSLEEFNDQLYAGAGNPVDGGQVWRSSNGTDWMPVSELGFTSTLTNTNPYIPDLIEFDGQLYAGTSWGDYPGQIWRSLDGTTWEPVVEDGFGDPNNNGITTFTVFSDTLYAATMNNSQGTEIWGSETGDNWSRVVNGGWGYSTNNGINGFTTFDGYLYAAVESFHTGGTCQIWRTLDG